ncbi:MAG TPA: DCC1-like thiol-disulfide oxidoreductase family protein [Thermoanaerobaculia bacterium]|nr:DCC1-like thiol-disulfide oxidoreductase family protein [Thermoanaerobaculia bacterium]
MDAFPPGRHLLLYDGVCGLCDRSVQFCLAHDQAGRFLYAPLQGETARELAARLPLPADLETVVLITDPGTPGERVHLKSDAFVALLRHLGGIWRVLSWLRVIPRPLRDAAYDFVAARRYRWFGRFDTCRLPAPGTAERFLP